MIPEFNDDGYLPPGLHLATFEEIAERFGQETEIRQAQIQSLGWLLDIVHRGGVVRLVVNGSFVTDRPEPNDVDCVLLLAEGGALDPETDKELCEGLPYLQLSLVTQLGFNRLVARFYATDRQSVPKGMIEVIL